MFTDFPNFRIQFDFVFSRIESSANQCLNFVSALEICSMPAEVGPCRGIYNRFAFDRQQNRCVAFNYGGCRGNQNNFFSYAECQKQCQNIY